MALPRLDATWHCPIGRALLGSAAMKSLRRRHLYATGTMVLTGLLVSCGSGSRERPRFNPASEIHGVRLACNKATLARKRAETISKPRIPPSPAGEREAARADFLKAYTEAQRALAAFLQQAIACCPRAPETGEALALYAGEALAHAHFLVTNGGDAAQARAAVRQAEELYVASGRAVPGELSKMLRAIALASTPAPTRSVQALPAPN